MRRLDSVFLGTVSKSAFRLPPPFLSVERNAECGGTLILVCALRLGVFE
jgi:hypothetical protein